MPGNKMPLLNFKEDGPYLDDYKLKTITDLKITSSVNALSEVTITMLVDVHGLDNVKTKEFFKDGDSDE